MFLRGHPNILKRLLIQVCGANLGLLMRQLIGVGTPRSLQGRVAAIRTALLGLVARLWGHVRGSRPTTHQDPFNSLDLDVATRQHEHLIFELRISPSATGC